MPKNYLYVSVMSKSVREHKDVIQVNHITNIEKVLEYVFGKCLNHGITKSKKHHQILEMPITSTECCISLISLTDVRSIYNSKSMCTLKMVQRF